MKVSISKQLARILSIALLNLVISIGIIAQYVPNALNYQAVARDSQGKAINAKNITVQISIISIDPNGNVEWKEEHNVQTNSLGLFTLNIGIGNKTGGTATSFSAINWGKNPHFLKVEIDFGTGLEYFGTSQMLAVPYALYAEKAGNSEPDFSGFTFDPTNNTLKNNETTVADLTPLKQSLAFDQSNYHLSISGTSGIVDFQKFIHAPQDLRIANNKIWITGNSDSTIVDLLPYKQSLSVNANSNLEISYGNSVKIDTSNVNEIQTISLTGSKITLSKSGGEITIDPSESNEIQDLVSAGNKLSLSKSNAPQVEFDRSETNELQTLTKSDDKLILSNSNGRAIPIDTSLVNEIQTLEQSGNKLSLTNSANQIEFDRSETNEILTSVDYNKSTKVITLNEGIHSKTVDISPLKVAFRAIKSTNTNVSAGNYTMIFPEEKIDLNNNYDVLTGVFTVPLNGAGTYSFFFTSEVSGFSLQYELLKNDQNEEILLPYNQPIILDLIENDTIKIKVTASEETSVRKASFVGYKIN